MSQQMTKAQQTVSDVRGLLERSRAQIAMALPKHLTPERMIRVAVTALQRTPHLQECSPLSLVGCVVQASELGLELTGPLGQAYMVPYWNKNTKQQEAQFQVGYRGLMDLAYRSGRVENFSAHIVYKNDRFQFSYGTANKLVHVPTMDEPGDVVAAYAVVKMKGGGVDFEVMSKKQIDAHRERYSKQKADGQFNPWNTAWEEMAKKTVIRRLAKRVPLSIEIAKAAALDEYAEAGLPQNLDLGLEPGSAPPPAGASNLNGNGQANGGPTTHGAAGDAEAMTADQDAEIAEELKRTGAFAGDVLKAAGASDFASLTKANAEKVLSDLRALPDKETPPAKSKSDLYAQV